MEQWKQIKAFPRYEVSTLGNVRHFKHKRILKQRDNNGYRIVTLHNPGERYLRQKIHRLVAETFIHEHAGPVDHINRIRYDNRLENLRCTTTYENNLNKGTISHVRIEKIIDLHNQGRSIEEILALV